MEPGCWRGGHREEQRKMSKEWLNAVKWDDRGLVPAIAQDAATKEILMVAWMNAESLELSLQEGRAIYWSRSRQKLWRKGEESGNVQQLREIRLDCDSDVLLLKVEQIGTVACHTGRRSCFYRKLDDNSLSWETVEQVLKDPNDMYAK
ncbi:MAG TPA: phosphoribosyl-AMP cyclohydrolase [Marinobacterium sp.]|nr:phosphoribosyl-AMP cyclohydrolase [Marinobacterium sp.]